MHIVDVSVQNPDVIVAGVHQSAIDGHAIGIVIVVDNELSVIQVAQWKFTSIIDGELSHVIGLQIVSSVDDTVVHDDFPDGIE